MLAENVSHRAVLLGPDQDAQRSYPGCTARLELNGTEVHRLERDTELPGELVEVIRDMSELLATAGAQFRAGEVIITGGIVPPVKVAPGDRVRASIEPLGELELVFS